MGFPTLSGSPRPGYERVTCAQCKGKGRLKRKPGQSYSTMRDGRRGPRCHSCGGLGVVEHKIVGLTEHDLADSMCSGAGR